MSPLIYPVGFYQQNSGTLLDPPSNIANGAILAYSTRKIKSDYTGYPGRIIGRTNTTEDNFQDISFSNNIISSSEILTYCTNNSVSDCGFLPYDQSGNSNHAQRYVGQNNLSLPRIAAAGGVNTENNKPTLLMFDDATGGGTGNASCFQFSSVISSVNDFEFMGVCRTSKLNSYIVHGATRNNQIQLNYRLFERIYFSDFNNFHYGFSAPSLSSLNIIGASRSGNSLKIYCNGIEIYSGTSSVVLGWNSVAPPGVNSSILGAYPELMLWNEQLSNSERADKVADIKTYYGIP